MNRVVKSQAKILQDSMLKTITKKSSSFVKPYALLLFTSKIFIIKNKEERLRFGQDWCNCIICLSK